MAGQLDSLSEAAMSTESLAASSAGKLATVPKKSLAGQLDLMRPDLLQKVMVYVDWQHHGKLKWDAFRAWRWKVEGRKSAYLVTRCYCKCRIRQRANNHDVIVHDDNCDLNGEDNSWWRHL